MKCFCHDDLHNWAGRYPLGAKRCLLLGLVMIGSGGCGPITACPPHAFDLDDTVMPLPDVAAPGPEIRKRQPGDSWVYLIRRNQWDDGALFALNGNSHEVVEAERRADLTGFETTSSRSDTSFFSCEGVFVYGSTFREFLSQDASGETSLHGYSFEDEARSETTFINKPAVGRVVANPEFAVGATRTVSFQYDNGVVVESTRTIEGVDRVSVKAGTFVAFRLRRNQRSVDDEGETITAQTSWIVPELSTSVLSYSLRRTTRTYGSASVLEEVWELVDFSLHGR